MKIRRRRGKPCIIDYEAVNDDKDEFVVEKDWLDPSGWESPSVEAKGRRPVGLQPLASPNQGGKVVSVVSFSGGKDSTAMLHLLLEQGIKPDFVITFETEWEFPQIWEHVRAVEEKTGLKITRLRYYRRFDDLLEWYGWPGYRGGWCTARKTTTCNRFIRAVGASTEFLGFTTNERGRAESKELQKKKWEVRFPLIEAGMSEEDSLRFCLDLGYDFGGLYNIFNRVSCFCCPGAGKKRREIIRREFPELWEEWLRKDALAKQRLIEKYRRTT